MIYGQNLFSSLFQDQVLIWFLEGIKSAAEADKISVVKDLSITGIICLTISSYLLLLLLIALNDA